MAKKKSTPKIPVIKTAHKRGSNRIVLELGNEKRPLENTEVALIDFDWKKTDNLRRKHKPDGRHYMPPRGIIVVFKVEKGGEIYHFSKTSPHTLVINRENIANFVADTLDELKESWNSAKESIKEANENDEEPEDIDGIPAEYAEQVDPRYITEIAINFLY